MWSTEWDLNPMNTGFADQRVSHFAIGALVRTFLIDDISHIRYQRKKPTSLERVGLLIQNALNPATPLPPQNTQASYMLKYSSDSGRR